MSLDYDIALVKPLNYQFVIELSLDEYLKFFDKDATMKKDKEKN